MRLTLPGTPIPWKRLLAEFGVIVAGVLIALAADSWWERQQEQDRAEEYLAQLLLDFERTENQLKGAIAGENERLQQVSQVIERALQGPLPPADSLDFHTGYNQFAPLVGTLGALIQSGDLRLLRSNRLQFELIAFLGLVQDIEPMLRHTEGLIWHSAERLTLGRARHSRAYGTNAARAWKQVDVAAALADPELVSALQIQAMASQIRIFNLGRLEEPTRNIITLIRAESE